MVRTQSASDNEHSSVGIALLPRARFLSGSGSGRELALYFLFHKAWAEAAAHAAAASASASASPIARFLCVVVCAVFTRERNPSKYRRQNLEHAL
jgi:hypothetical protein